MPTKILKAGSIVYLPKPVESGGNTLETARGAETVDSQESQLIIAETKLVTCKLINDAKRQAEEIIDRAREQATQILSQAESESAAVKEMARKEGYESGYRDGQLALQDERRRLAEDRTLQEKAIEQERAEMIRALEPELIELSLQIARKIIHAELKMAPEQAVRIAEAVLSRVKDLDNAILKLSADDFANVTDALAGKTKNGAKTRFRVDNTLESGDCLAVTTHGTVDGTIEGQLEEIGHRLMEAAGNG